MNIEEIKKQRSASKRKLTTILNKLKTSLQYGDTSFKDHYTSAVAEYDNIVDLDYQVSELEDCESTYINDVNPRYHEVIKMYYDSLKEEKDIKKAKKLRQVSEALDESIVNLEPILERTRIILTNEVWTDLGKREYLELELNNTHILFCLTLSKLHWLK